MAYIDEDYLRRRFTDEVVSASVSFNGTLESVTGSLISDVLEESSDFIDSYLEPFYDAPVDSGNAMLKGLCADRAMTVLYTRANMEIPEYLSVRMLETSEYLQELSEYRIRIKNVSTDQEKDPGGFYISTGSTSSQLGIGLRGYLI